MCHVFNSSPLGFGRHEDRPPGLYVPSGHLSMKNGLGHSYPGGQLKQSEELSPLYVPVTS